MSKREEPGVEREEQPQSKRLKHPTDCSNLRVFLNPADCDLAFNIEADGLTGHALHEHGFAYCWSGARGTVGITGGKYYFGCKIVSHQPVEMEDTPPDQQNVCRIGISRGVDPVGNLGETENSYGFGGTGKFSSGGRFADYGEKFGVGDTIVCLVDLESKPLGSVEFCKNGRRLGIAKKLDLKPKALKLPWESAFFPHVLLKNTVVQMKFSLEDGLTPIEGYKPWVSALKDEKAIVGPSLAEPTECEVIMMVGLPASGKSTWAEKWIKEHPEKRYVLLGTNLALDQMKVPGLLRKNNYGERFDRLMDRATGIFNTLLSRASKVPRNYILDQTNVYKSARRRKLKPFAFYRKIAVVVFRSAGQLKLRSEKRYKEMGKDVPTEAVKEMLANFVLPMSKDMHGTDEYFDQIIFTDLNRSEAQQYLDEMKYALASSSRSENLAYSTRSSRQSDSSLSTYALPGARHPYSIYNGGFTAGRFEPVVPTFRPNVNTAYKSYMQPARVDGAQRYQASVNPGYGSSASTYQGSVNPVQEREAYQGAYLTQNDSVNPVQEREAYQGAYLTQNDHARREEPICIGGYMRDPFTTQPHGPPVGHMSNPGAARSANQPSCGSSYPTENPTSRGLYQYPTSDGQYGAITFGHPNLRACGSYPENIQQPGPGSIPNGPGTQGQYPSPCSSQDPNSQGQYQKPTSGQHAARPYEHPDSRAWGNHPANMQQPGLGSIAYGPSTQVQYPSPCSSQDPSSQGKYQYTTSEGQYGASPNGHPDLRAFGSYIANVQQPGPETIACRPPRYY